MTPHLESGPDLQRRPHDPARRTRRRPATLAGVAALSLALLSGVTACSHGRGGGSAGAVSGSSGASSSVAKGGDASVPGAAPVVAPAATGATGGSSSGRASSPLLQQRRLILQTALSLTVRNVAQAADRVRQATTAAGGYVGDEQTGGTGTSARSSLTLEVPSAQLATVTGVVAALGTVRSRSENSADVTQQSVDVSSRLATERASVARVRALLSRATRISDVVLIEGELSTRESNLESMEAQLKSLDDQVALATLNVTLTAQGAAARPPATADTGFLAGLGHGWHAFVTALVVALTVVGAVLPFLVLLALLAVPAWLVARRRRSTPGAPAAVAEP